MPVKIIHPDHVEIVGVGRVLLTTPQSAISDESNIGSMVEESALTSRSFAVIGKISREYAEPTRIASARSDLRKTIDSYIVDEGIKYVVEVHGKPEPGISLWTRDGQTCSTSTVEISRSRLGESFEVTVNDSGQEMDSSSALKDLARKDAQGNFQTETIQLQIGLEQRQFQREKVISRLSEIADLLNAQPGQSRTN